MVLGGDLAAVVAVDRGHAVHVQAAGAVAGGQGLVVVVGVLRGDFITGVF